MKAYYKAMKCPNQLQALTQEMLQRSGKGPRLKSKGGETRHLIMFGLELAKEMDLANNTLHSKT
eukprot:9977903-Alexandrium_andersonii.AAC.1